MTVVVSQNSRHHQSRRSSFAKRQITKSNPPIQRRSPIQLNPSSVPKQKQMALALSRKIRCMQSYSSRLVHAAIAAYIYGQFGETHFQMKCFPLGIPRDEVNAAAPLSHWSKLPINIFLMDLRSAQIGLDIYPEVECPSKRIFHLGSLKRKHRR